MNYVNRIVDSIASDDELIAFQNNVFAISNRIKNFIEALLSEYRYNNFKQKLNRNEIFIKELWEFPQIITPTKSISEFPKSLYSEEDGNINNLERTFVRKVASLDNVDWWHRLLDRNDYFINGFINHYPDFIVKTKSGHIVLVETKGEHLDGDDSKRKLELGRLWSNYSNPSKYKYFMAFERSPLNEDGADLVDNIVVSSNLATALLLIISLK